ncbi:MAG: hypothetical protein J5517_07745 [Eubacterium sp.]|nr:hypothetical protein [Eubacterium sp.]
MIPGLTFKEYIAQEKEKLAEMTGEEKKQYFKDYYLKFVIGGVVVLILLIWFIVDISFSARPVAASGGMINLTLSDEGKTFLTDDYLEYLKLNPRTNQVQLASDIILSKGSETSYTDFMAMQAELATNSYNYLIVNEEGLECCLEIDYSMFEDPNKILDDDLKKALADKIGFHLMKEAESSGIKETDKDAPGCYAIDITGTEFVNKYITSNGSVYFLFTGSMDDYDRGMSVLRYILGM